METKKSPRNTIVVTSYNNGIILVLDKLDASATKQLVVRYHPTDTRARTYAKRTQAELSYKQGGNWKDREYIGGEFKNTAFLRVPPEHKDHSWFIRYEGPGWESDKVGYRSISISAMRRMFLGRLRRLWCLQQVGLDGFDSYHNMQPWGMECDEGREVAGCWLDGSLYMVRYTRGKKPIA
jgi:hypothetical protein